MLTRTMFSTISYNTDDWLKDKLNNLVEDRTLLFWCFINHKKEKDENKDHKHVLFVPNGSVETSAISRYLEEFDPTYPDKPLKCGVFKHSQFADWYLYALHDADYLASKGQERAFHYQSNEFISYDSDYFWELVHTSDFTKWKKEAEFKRACKSGKTTFEDLLLNGFVPIQQIYQYRMAWHMLTDSALKNQVSNIIDNATGEILSIGMPFDDANEGD